MTLNRLASLSVFEVRPMLIVLCGCSVWHISARIPPKFSRVLKADSYSITNFLAHGGCNVRDFLPRQLAPYFSATLLPYLPVPDLRRGHHRMLCLQRSAGRNRLAS